IDPYVVNKLAVVGDRSSAVAQIAGSNNLHVTTCRDLSHPNTNSTLIDQSVDDPFAIWRNRCAAIDEDVVYATTACEFGDLHCRCRRRFITRSGLKPDKERYSDNQRNTNDRQQHSRLMSFDFTNDVFSAACWPY